MYFAIQSWSSFTRARGYRHRLRVPGGKEGRTLVKGLGAQRNAPPGDALVTIPVAGATSFVPVPEISRFFGVVIAMYYDDHPSPHFHVRYGECRATLEVDAVAVLAAGQDSGVGATNWLWAGAPGPGTRPAVSAGRARGLEAGSGAPRAAMAGERRLLA